MTELEDDARLYSEEAGYRGELTVARIRDTSWGQLESSRLAASYATEAGHAGRRALRVWSWFQQVEFLKTMNSTRRENMAK